MKKGRVWLCAALVLLGVLMFSVGVSRYRAVAGQAQEKAKQRIAESLVLLQDAGSMGSTLSMDMEMDVWGLRVLAQVGMNTLAIRNPMKLRADLVLDMGWLGSSNLQIYAVEGEEEEGYQIYVRREGEWSTGTLGEEVGKYDGASLMAAYLEQMDEVLYDGTEELPGGSAARYSGVVHSDGLQKVLLDTGCLELLLTLLEEKLPDALGSMLSQNEDMIPELMSRSEDLKVTLWIDETSGYPVQCAMDLTELLDAALGEMTANSAENSNGWLGLKFLSAGWAGIVKTLTSGSEVTNAQLLIQCDSFGEVEDFQIPEAALEALTEAPRNPDSR